MSDDKDWKLKKVKSIR